MAPRILIYTSQKPPYRTGNWPMMSPSELMNLPGFGADRYRKIAPYVTALPAAPSAKINIVHRLRRWYLSSLVGEGLRRRMVRQS